MKTIEIEKHLELNDAVDLLPMVMKDHFIYKKEENGIRCIGPFFMKGRYTTVNEVKDFQDVFEFDIFAGNEKLDGDTFSVNYEGYDYTVEGGVTLYLHFNVRGVIDEEECSSEVEVVNGVKGKEEPVPIDTFHLPRFDENVSPTMSPYINMGSEGVGTNYEKEQIFYREEDDIIPDVQMEGVSSSYFKQQDVPVMKQQNAPDLEEREIKTDKKAMSNRGNEGVGNQTSLSMDADNEGRTILEIPKFSKVNKEEEILTLAKPEVKTIEENEELEYEEPVIHTISMQPTQKVAESEKTMIMKEEKTENVSTNVENGSVEINQLDQMEELFDTKDSVTTSYSFVVVKHGDTYDSIAKRYHVDEERLKQANRNKEIHEKALVVLPYLKP